MDKDYCSQDCELAVIGPIHFGHMRLEVHEASTAPSPQPP